jgi:hypothetical protein
MIWHIFKKDAKLLWIYVVGVAAVHAATAIILYELTRSTGAARSWAELLNTIPVIAYLGMAFVTAMAVLQDPLVGVRQDWLVRPIRRMDLLLAKLLFVILLVQGPLFFADLIGGLASGFALHQCLAAAFSRDIFIFLAYNLWAFALATLIRNLSDAVIAGVIVAVAAVGFQLVVQALFGRGSDQTLDTGIAWFSITIRLALSLVASTIVLVVQFAKRKTLVLRAFAAAVLLIALLTRLIPWRTAFAAEQSIFRRHAAPNPISIAFDPSLGRYQREAGAADLNMLSRDKRDPSVSEELFYLPLRMNALPPNSVVKLDRAEYSVSIPGGRILYSGTGGMLLSTGDLPQQSSAQYETIRIPISIYHAIADSEVSLSVHYSGTTFGLQNSFAIPAVGGEERMPGFGACTTSIDSDGDGIAMRCEQIGNPPTCAQIFLEHAPTGKRNPETLSCPGDYSPYFGKLLYDDLSRFGTELDFRDLNGLARYPVDGSMLQDARVVIRNFTPQSHFTRDLSISSIRLSDWQSR